MLALNVKSKSSHNAFESFTVLPISELLFPILLPQDNQLAFKHNILRIYYFKNLNRLPMFLMHKTKENKNKPHILIHWALKSFQVTISIFRLVSHLWLSQFHSKATSFLAIPWQLFPSPKGTLYIFLFYLLRSYLSIHPLAFLFLNLDWVLPLTFLPSPMIFKKSTYYFLVMIILNFFFFFFQNC